MLLIPEKYEQGASITVFSICSHLFEKIRSLPPQSIYLIFHTHLPITFKTNNNGNIILYFNPSPASKIVSSHQIYLYLSVFSLLLDYPLKRSKTEIKWPLPLTSIPHVSLLYIFYIPLSFLDWCYYLDRMLRACSIFGSIKNASISKVEGGAKIILLSKLVTSISTLANYC